MSEVSPRVTLAPGARLGAFVLEGQVAVGGMAEIWSGRRVADGARRALKILRSEFTRDAAFRAMFEDEVRIATQLQHRNIVAVFGVEEAGGHLFQIMELVDGWDLRRVLSHLVRTGRRWPVRLALFVAREVAEGLSYAHTRVGDAGRPLNIVHRDVSPHNVMLGADGRVRVLDFGIARAAERTSRTRTGIIKGKLAYMAPEQALAVGVTPQTDIFAAGVVLWEMLALERLFAGSSDAEVVERVVKAEVPPIRDHNPEVPEAAAQLLSKMLAQRAPDRPATMADVQRALDRILADELGGPEAGEVGEAALQAWLLRHGPEPREDADTRLPGGGPTPPPGVADTGPSAAEPTVTMAADPTWPQAAGFGDSEPVTFREATPLPEEGSPDTNPEAMPPELARTLVDADMGFSLAQALGGTPTPRSAATPSGGDARPADQRFRRPTATEIMQAVDAQPTVEVAADPEVQALGQALFQRRAPAPVVATVGRDAYDTVALEPPTKLGPLVPEPMPQPATARAARPAKGETGSITPLSPRAAATPGEAISVVGVDTPDRGFEPIGARPRPAPTELEQPRPSFSQPPAPPRGQWVLPVITLALAAVVLVLIFMLIRGQ
jgi:hypothetical protein